MPLHRFPPRLWEALRRERGLCARLPGHYLRRLREEEAAAPAPVHWRPLARRQQQQQVQEAPVSPRLPPESQQGLWGGEGWVVGFRYANNDKVGGRPAGRAGGPAVRTSAAGGMRAGPSPPPTKQAPPNVSPPSLCPQLSVRVKKIWKPQLFHRELYSEILDKRLRVTVTMRTLDQIDAAYGFDFYILKVTSQLAGTGEDSGRCPSLSEVPSPWQLCSLQACVQGTGLMVQEELPKFWGALGGQIQPHDPGLSVLQLSSAVGS